MKKSFRFKITALMLSGVLSLSAFSAIPHQSIFAQSENTNVKGELTTTGTDIKLDNADNSSTIDRLSAEKPELQPVSSIRPVLNRVGMNNLLEYEMGGVDDEIRRSTVPLASRQQGTKVNPLASEDAKIQSLAYLGSNSPGHSAVGGGIEGFKVYAFDYWQYLNEMVFWDGLIPNPDMTDAAHRNGVPMLGTMFFNWSTSQADQEQVRYVLQESDPGVFPVGEKLVDIAKYYGFDGYFINQETSMPTGSGWSEKFIGFLNYTKTYAESINYPIQIAWYDSMANSGSRYHGNAVNSTNNMFMEKNNDGSVAVDQFFMNFNWQRNHVDTTVAEMEKLGRNQFDTYAGLELQAGGSYRTNMKVSALVDDNNQTRLSLGLFIPDTIMGMSLDGADYHEQENTFWTGHGGNPTTADDSNSTWSGIARLVADKTAITGNNFYTNFNTGHGTSWYVDGQKSSPSDWNSRSIQDFMPTWRWWFKSNANGLSASYDFNDAYNGGNSIRLTGSVGSGASSEAMLYSTFLNINGTSKLSVSHKLSHDAKVEIGLYTDPDYTQATYYTLANGDNWQENEISLSGLAGQTVYGISVRVTGNSAASEFALNLGTLGITDNSVQPSSPTGASVLKQNIFNAAQSDAIIQVSPVTGARTYEVYAKQENMWEFVNASSSNLIYLPNITRFSDAIGTTQELQIIAVGENGVKSEPLVYDYDWKIELNDAPQPQKDPANIMLELRMPDDITAVNDRPFNPDSGNAEGPMNLFNGTITNTADKWWNPGPGSVSIKFHDGPRTVVRWAIDHAGAGGESVNDGLMNTKDFDLMYKDMETGEWVIAQSIRGNIAHVTDEILEEPITAEEWKLNVIDPDNGSPWGGLRIYNWRMYEELRTETQSVPNSQLSLVEFETGIFDLFIDAAEPNIEIIIYEDREGNNEIARTILDSEGNGIVYGLSGNPGDRIFYRSLAAGLEPSVPNVIFFPESEVIQEIQSTEFAIGDFQTTYLIGNSLDQTTEVYEVVFQDEAGELITERYSLANPLLVAENYNPEQKGKQEVVISFRGEEVGTVTVTVLDESDLSTYPTESIEFAIVPRTTYRFGDEFVRTNNGSIIVVYEGGLRGEPISLNARDANDEFIITISDFDPLVAGQQLVSFSIGTGTITYEVTVEPANKEYLNQNLSQVDAIFTTEVEEEIYPEVLANLGEYRDIIDNARSLSEDVLATQSEIDDANRDLENLLNTHAILFRQVDEIVSGVSGVIPTIMKFSDDITSHNSHYLITDNNPDTYDTLSLYEAENQYLELVPALDSIVTNIELTNRTNASRRPESVEVLYTLDGTEWISLGNHPVEEDNSIDLSVMPIVKAQAIRVVPNNVPNVYSWGGFYMGYWEVVDLTLRGEKANATDEPSGPSGPEDLVLDTTALEVAITAAGELVRENFTDETLAVLDSALADAQSVLDNPEATQIEVDVATAALTTAIEELVPVEVVEPVDKSALEAAITAAGEVVRENFTEESLAILDSALADSQTVLDNPEATLIEVDVATATLTTAIEELVPVEVVEPVDKYALETAITTAREVVRENFTEESLATLDSALVDAQAVLGNPEATQAEVEVATAALTTAIEGLVEVETEEPEVDKTALEAAITEAQEVVREDYTADSLAVLDSVLLHAQSVQENADVRQADVDIARASLTAAIEGLVPVEVVEPVDKSALQAAIAEAQAVVREEYTEESLATLDSVLLLAEAVQENAEVTQAEVNVITSALTTAIEGLVAVEVIEPVDKSALEAAIADAQAVVREDYTEESLATLDSVLLLAEAVQENAEVTQAEVNVITSALTTAIEGLVAVEVVDTTALEAAIAEAENIIREDYTDESLAILDSEIEEAQAVLANEVATQANVDAAETALRTAIDGLVSVDTEEPEVVDTTALESAIAEAVNIVREDYTDESLTILDSAIEEAQTVLANEEATQADVDAAETALRTAIDGLVPVDTEEPEVLDTKALETAIAAAEAVSTEDYTTESVAALETALTGAQAVLANEEATQADVDAAVVALRTTIDGLVPVVVDPDPTPEPTPEPTEPTLPTDPTEPTKETLEILEADSTYNGVDSVIVRTNGELETLVEVAIIIDGVEHVLTAEQYTAESGSTVVTISAEVLNGSGIVDGDEFVVRITHSEGESHLGGTVEARLNTVLAGETTDPTTTEPSTEEPTEETTTSTTEGKEDGGDITQTGESGAAVIVALGFLALAAILMGVVIVRKRKYND